MFLRYNVTAYDGKTFGSEHGHFHAAKLRGGATFLVDLLDHTPQCHQVAFWAF